MSKPFWPQPPFKLVEAIHAFENRTHNRFLLAPNMHTYIHTHQQILYTPPYSITALAVDILSHSNYYANYTKINGENIS